MTFDPSGSHVLPDDMISINMKTLLVLKTNVNKWFDGLSCLYKNLHTNNPILNCILRCSAPLIEFIYNICRKLITNDMKVQRTEILSCN